MEDKCFVAFGNPLVDATVEIEDDELLRKYGLKKDEQMEISAEVLDSILNDVKSRLQDFAELPQGRCVCLVTGARRTLVANIGAAGHYSLHKLKGDPNLQKILDEAACVHVEGFFLKNRFDVCKYLVERRPKLMTYNLGAKYVIETLGEESQYMAEHADIVFGNASEYRALSRRYGLDDAEDCALLLHGKSSGRIVVTDDRNPVLVVWGGRKRRYVVPAQQSVLDTTGAGDAFLAGFVWALMNGLEVDRCAEFAIRLAGVCVGYVGVKPPEGVQLPCL